MGSIVVTKQVKKVAMWRSRLYSIRSSRGQLWQVLQVVISGIFWLVFNRIDTYTGGFILCKVPFDFLTDGQAQQGAAYGGQYGNFICSAIHILWVYQGVGKGLLGRQYGKTNAGIHGYHACRNRLW